jgi:hypothetical protein
MISFEVKNRFNNAVQFVAKIQCDESASYSTKMGLAVQWAVNSGANLGGAYLREADLGGAYLRGANLGGAYLRGADLRGANLGGAYLRGANLRGAYLRGADLRGADLGGAYLRGADLRGADLGGAYLRGVDLRGANLGGLILIARVTRSDDYEYFAWTSILGGMVITAGCRTWQDQSVLTPGKAIEHARNHCAHQTNAAFRTEALSIVEHIERMAA